MRNSLSCVLFIALSCAPLAALADDHAAPGATRSGDADPGATDRMTLLRPDPGALRSRPGATAGSLPQSRAPMAATDRTFYLGDNCDYAAPKPSV